MRSRILGLVCLLVASGAAIFWWSRPDVSQSVEIRAPGELPAATAPTGTAEVEARPAESDHPAEPEPATTTPAPETPPGKTDGKNPFRVDSTGKLVLDEQTRLNMEALFAQTDRADLLDAQQDATAKLPPAAAAEATALLERYENYSKQQRQSYPPGIAPTTEEAALAELDGLHALRVAHFGPEAARAFFGAEEEVTRSLIDLMRLEKDQSLTLQEKAERAQKLHDQIEAGQRH
ncbi:lipase secretion chaperone [Peristeroidobacter agariperforans]|uniref:lipase secretion chaperone n=1 Tax=Peristeroidobacter agariperforans TaxID=268404 RepID=UPI0013002555|nr:lipase secretion chaperone [Peristeroidobacter agariperforans]